MSHGSALEGSDPHELAGGFEACQMKGTVEPRNSDSFRQQAKSHYFEVYL